jgi:hypothetical protein
MPQQRKAESRDRDVTLMDAQLIVEAQAAATDTAARTLIVMLHDMERRREQLRAISARLNRLAA